MKILAKLAIPLVATKVKVVGNCSSKQKGKQKKKAKKKGEIKNNSKEI